MPSSGESVASRIAAYEGFFGNRTLRAYSTAAISNASVVFNGYTGTANDPIANYKMTWTSTSPRILVEFGAHLAQGEDFLLDDVGYGTGRGAGSISGGPYHVTLISSTGRPWAARTTRSRPTPSRPRRASPSTRPATG